MSENVKGNELELSKAMEQFFEYLGAIKRSPKTIENYKGHLSRFERFLMDKYNCPSYIGEIKTDDFEKYLYESPNGKNFTPVTRNAIITAFKSLYSFCYKKGFTKENLGSKVKLVTARAKERTFITEEELLKMVAVIKDRTDKAIMQTMFYTGIRIGEAMGITFDDINFKDNHIFIRKHKTRDDRKIPISIKLEEILEDYLEYRRNEIGGNNNKVFVHESSGKYSETHFNQMVKEAAEMAGLNMKISSHIMRHSFASNLIAKGVDIVKVQKLLGHNSIRTTSIYLHTNMQALKKAVSTL